MIYKVECIVGKWKKNPETKTVFLKENEIDKYFDEHINSK